MTLCDVGGRMPYDFQPRDWRDQRDRNDDLGLVWLGIAVRGRCRALLLPCGQRPQPADCDVSGRGHLDGGCIMPSPNWRHLWWPRVDEMSRSQPFIVRISAWALPRDFDRLSVVYLPHYRITLEPSTNRDFRPVQVRHANGSYSLSLLRSWVVDFYACFFSYTQNTGLWKELCRSLGISNGVTVASNAKRRLCLTLHGTAINSRI